MFELLRQALILATLVLPLVIFLQKRNARLRLPPGPKPLPIIGNVLEIPTERSWIKYAEWGRIYGDVIHIKAFGQSMIVLNSAKAIFDLLERRGGLYADRPPVVMAGDLVGWNNSPFLGQSGPRHKEYRRLFAEVLSARKVEEWRHLQQAKVIQLAAQLMKSPDAFRPHIKSHVGNLIFEISHGHVVKDENDALLSVAQQVDHDFAEMVVPGAFLVDVFPILRHIPSWTGISFKRKAKQYRETLSAALEWPYQQVKDQIAAGTALPSFTTGLIERKEHATEGDEFNWKWASLGFVLAGSDTSYGSLTSFVLAMSLHPEVQRKAQAEIDSVVGNSRLPTFLDRPDMPYVEGVMREVYRWNPVGPIASPHRLTTEADDVYRDWTIPKGSIVIANSWGVMHDPEVYPDPFEFDPERYTLGKTSSDGIRVWNDPLGPDQMVNPDPRKFAFGYGRRICPGQLLADDTVFMGVVTMLALFNIGPLTSGKPPQYTPNVISHPEHFACSIKPRSEQAQELVMGH
ncbi:cytochrome P450 [Lentinula aff. detonsa]|uniref:Cytochrome P450 n=1 Tax=Lentinula aff. detonsa TaxID=2804958 RepID=A0AA38L1W7_9AGAR|nr:cytochrome P450 [Lentinula aff. detonsa]KAJ3797759.1 cytochrome P450 [Lentinula aff. detonsa]